MKFSRFLGLFKGGFFWVGFILILALTACQLISPEIVENDETPVPNGATRTGFPLVTQDGQETVAPVESQQPTSEPSLTPEPVTLWVAPYLPLELSGQLTLPQGVQLVNDPSEAKIHLKAGNGYPVTEWVYALVVPFSTVPDGVSGEDIQLSWQGNPSGPLGNSQILTDEHTLGVFTAKWGEPAPEAVTVLPAEELIQYAWDQQLYYHSHWKRHNGDVCRHRGQPDAGTVRTRRSKQVDHQGSRACLGLHAHASARRRGGW